MSVNEEEEEEAAAGDHECECAQTATLDSRGEEEQEPFSETKYFIFPNINSSILCTA